MKISTLFIRDLVISTLMLCGAAAHAQPGELHPNSSDDTEQLQAALADCTDPKTRCEIRLGPGVFYTDVLFVAGFNGAITGRGEGQTIIKPLERQTLRSTAQPFVDEPTLEQPYPVLLHFAANSKVAISRLTLDFSSGFTVSSYDLSYTAGVTNALVAAVQVDGDSDASLLMTKVTIKGVDNDSYFGSNVSAAIVFEGEVRPGDDVDLTRILQRGELTIQDVRIERGGIGISLRSANNVRSLIGENVIDARIYGVYTENLGSSRIRTIRNRIDVDLEGILMAQDGRPPAERSDYWIAHNRIKVNESGRATEFDTSAYDGIGVFDFLEGNASIAANFNIIGNDITLAENVIAGVAIDSAAPGVRIIGNRIRGPANDAGVRVALSRGTVVAGNDLRAVQPGVADVYLLETTRDCKVVQPGASVEDDGTNNRVIN